MEYNQGNIVVNPVKYEVSIAIIRGDKPIPKRQTQGSAGYDLYFNPPDGQPLTVRPNETVKLHTGIALQPEGDENSDIFCIIYPRSGLASKGLYPNLGVIDSDYTGEIIVIMTNVGKEDYTFNPGDRIAQLLFFQKVHVDFRIVDDLTDTERGKNGFGSTGR